jgi:hypothetical protein
VAGRGACGRIERWICGAINFYIRARDLYRERKKTSEAFGAKIDEELSSLSRTIDWPDAGVEARSAARSWGAVNKRHQQGHPHHLVDALASGSFLLGAGGQHQ